MIVEKTAIQGKRKINKKCRRGWVGEKCGVRSVRCGVYGVKFNNYN